jgi:nucleoside-diphosphate-sugar epimerase
MRVFVTGASGHIGSAVVPELVNAGHHVTGLARSDASASALKSAGAEVRRGDLDDLEGLREAARASDGVIHLAYKHDLAFAGSADGYQRAAEHDLRAIKAMVEGLAGSNKPFVGTGGTALLAFTQLNRTGTEDDKLPAGPRIDAENFVVGLAEHGVRSSVIRLAPTVHSSLDHTGFIPMLIGMARKNGFAGYVGDGENRWPAVHTLDAARLYRLALEKAPAGSRLHGAAEQGVPFRAIAEALGRGLGLPATSLTGDDVAKLGALGRFAMVDNPISSIKTQQVLGWKPTHADLLADIAEGHYFVNRR